jgi:hypothetical protein
MNEVRAASMGSDRHTIVLAVNDFLGYAGIFCRNAKHSQHTFAWSETISCAIQAQE